MSGSKKEVTIRSSEAEYLINPQNFKTHLTCTISQSPKVLGIGQTGDLNAPLIPGKSDIDLFVICTEVPDTEERKQLYKALHPYHPEISMNVSNGGIWGYGDIFLYQGIDIMPMYFTIEEMRSYLEEVLDGKHLEREGRFYPIGRLASIETLNIIYEENKAWSEIIARVREYPVALFKAWYNAQSQQILDGEDLGRALLRKEVLFYHQVLEESMDHMLQALYAINRRYFPSRKRTEQAVETFPYKPERFMERLFRIVENSVRPEDIETSVTELKKLGNEVLELGQQYINKEDI